MEAKSNNFFSIKFSLALILLLPITLVVLALPFLAAKQLGYSVIAIIGLNSSNFYLFMMVSQTASLTLSILIISKRLKKYGLSWSSVGIKKFRFARSLKFIVGYYPIIFGILFSFALIAAVLTGGGSIDSNESATHGYASFGGFWPAFIITVLLAPIIEEVLFRGVLFTALRKRHGVVLAAVLGGLIFSLAHVGNPIQAIGALPLGVYLCIMYQRLGSILPGIILHASWNLLALSVR